MKKFGLICGLILFVGSICFAQESGNRNYNAQRRKPTTNSGDLIASSNGKDLYFVEASVAMNVRADTYVAVFGLSQEAPTAAESNSKVNGLIAAFTRELNALGVKNSDVFVDFITQNKVYDYTTTGSVTTEKLSGFETKKNIAVRYNDREVLEKIIASAAKNSIFDLIKVDYIVNDIKSVNARLYEEAVKIIKQKEAAYTGSFGIKMSPFKCCQRKIRCILSGRIIRRLSGLRSGQYLRRLRK